MTPEKRRELARMGGKAVHAQGTGHEWTSQEAKAAGRKGGQASRGGRGKEQPEDDPDEQIANVGALR